VSKAKPPDPVTRRQWNRWSELDKKRMRGTLASEHELTEYNNLLDKLRQVSAYWRAARP
jgi:hypothetical protein